MDRNKLLRRKLVGIAVAFVALAGIGTLGASASPRLDGHPIVLSPDLARSTHFLRFVSSQLEVLQAADAQLVEALDQGAAASNLLDQVRGARVATEDALGVLTASEQEGAPFELESLRQSLQSASSVYAEAGRLTILFINTPTPEAQAAAAQAMEQARTSLEMTRELWTRLAPR